MIEISLKEFVGITPGKMRRFTLMVGKGPDTSKLEESRRVEIGSENVVSTEHAETVFIVS